MRVVDVTLPPFMNQCVAASAKKPTCLEMSVTIANHWKRSVTCRGIATGHVPPPKFFRDKNCPFLICSP